jgi:ABC-type branched-subunit amino acid transport system ATPase component
MGGSVASALSYGSQRRVEVARALATAPRFMFLDEPAAGLNEDESDELLDTLRQIHLTRKVGLVVIDHDLRLIMRLCTRVLVLDQGRVLADASPNEVRHDPIVIDAYLGARHPSAEPSSNRKQS